MRGFQGVEDISLVGDSNCNGYFADYSEGCEHGVQEEHGEAFEQVVEEHGEEDAEGDEEEAVEQDESGEEEQPLQQDGDHIYGTLMDVDFNSLTPNEVTGMVFGSINVAYDFYNQYGKMNGFSIRKNKRGKNKSGEVSWQQFVCSCKGFRRSTNLNNLNRQREHSVLKRFGCHAEMRVSLDGSSGRWYVSQFSDDHNHHLFGEKYYGLLRSHKNVSDGDVVQIDSMRKNGITIPKIYGSLAHQSCGYHLIGFRKKDIYNHVQKERRLHEGDMSEVENMLSDLRRNDPTLYWSHKVGDDGRLLHLIWCDGDCQIDYEVSGDVLAFDATYGRNKYKCPVVVFSGVNHHKKTCVFGCAIVSDEREETYVWVLEQFLQAMKGKSPTCVITDGDLAMKNAISSVFPASRHRLCGWHLIRNVTSNLRDLRFTQHFKTCMLANFEINDFEEMWQAAVEEFNLTDNEWVEQLYEKKKMWCIAYIRGKFFAGMRTTSRCEALHCHMGRYLHSRFNLCEFVHHFQRANEYIRSREREADFDSSRVPVMKTELVSLERYGSKVYTLEIFYLFRKRLFKSMSIHIVDCIVTATSKIFVVVQYGRPRKKWHVSFRPNELEVRCSCLSMESNGIPCSHIISVLVLLEFVYLPQSLVMQRWTKAAKEAAESRHLQGGSIGNNAMWNSRYTTLIDTCRRLCTHACRNPQLFRVIREKVIFEIQQIENNHRQQLQHEGGNQNERGNGSSHAAGYVSEPVAFTSQPCGSDPSVRGHRVKRIQRCGCCQAEGHTRRTCIHAKRIHHFVSCSQRPSTSSPPLNGYIYATDGNSHDGNGYTY